MDLLNERGHTMQHHELYPRLGLDVGRHLPDGGVPPTDVDGTTVYVLAANDPRRDRWVRGRRGGMILHPLSGKRTFAVCRCGEHVEAGHLGQHMQGRPCHEARGIEWVHPGRRTRWNGRTITRRYGQ